MDSHEGKDSDSLRRLGSLNSKRQTEHSKKVTGKSDGSVSQSFTSEEISDESKDEIQDLKLIPGFTSHQQQSYSKLGP